MKQVLFLKRQGGFFPGANPELDDKEADKLVADGVCVAYSDEARDQIKDLVAKAEAGTRKVCEEVTLPAKPAKPAK
jgi:hypothetical protein